MKSPMQYIYFALGWVFFATGVVGAFLPVLPTTPFMLLALAMFARSSRRFHHWLFNHKVFGPPLQQWENHRVIPLHAKVASVSMMTLSFLYMVLFTPMPVWAAALTGVFMLYGAWFVLTKPSRPLQCPVPKPQNYIET